MTKLTTREFVIATPTGQRVLISIADSDFATIGTAFEPPSDKSSQRLRLKPGEYERTCDVGSAPITVSADGTWINYRQLYAIANGIAFKSKMPISADYVRDMLFFDGGRPDVRAAFHKVFSTYDNSDQWWNMMYRFAWYDAHSGSLCPITRP